MLSENESICDDTASSTCCEERYCITLDSAYSSNSSTTSSNDHDSANNTHYNSECINNHTNYISTHLQENVTKIPTRTTALNTRKPAANPLQFIKVAKCDLYNTPTTATTNITPQVNSKPPTPIKTTQEKSQIKDESEDWQSNLDNWKFSRRKQQEHIIERIVQVKKLELEEHDRNKKSSKTFSKMMEERGSRGKKLNLPLYDEQDENDLTDLGITKKSDETPSNTEQQQQQQQDKNEDEERNEKKEEARENNDNINSNSSNSNNSNSNNRLEQNDNNIREHQVEDSRLNNGTTNTINNNNNNNNKCEEYTYDRAIQGYVDFTQARKNDNNNNNRRRSSIAIQEKLNQLQNIKQKSSSTDDNSQAIIEARINIPKVNIGQRKELFEQISNLNINTNTSPNKKKELLLPSSTSIVKKSITERINNLQSNNNNNNNKDNENENEDDKIIKQISPLKERLWSLENCKQSKQVTTMSDNEWCCNDNNNSNNNNDNEGNIDSNDEHIDSSNTNSFHRSMDSLDSLRSINETVDCLDCSSSSCSNYYHGSVISGDTTDREDSGIHTGADVDADGDVSSCVSQIDDFDLNNSVIMDDIDKTTKLQQTINDNDNESKNDDYELISKEEESSCNEESNESHITPQNENTLKSNEIDTPFNNDQNVIENDIKENKVEFNTIFTFDAAAISSQPPTEKPPPPPPIALSDDDDADSNELCKKSNLRRMDSTKRIKTELRQKRSSFLGIEFEDDNNEGFVKPPPPDIMTFLKQQRQMEEMTMYRQSMSSESDSTQGDSRDSGVELDKHILPIHDNNNMMLTSEDEDFILSTKTKDEQRQRIYENDDHYQCMSNNEQNTKEQLLLLDECALNEHKWTCKSLQDITRDKTQQEGQINNINNNSTSMDNMLINNNDKPNVQIDDYVEKTHNWLNSSENSHNNYYVPVPIPVPLINKSPLDHRRSMPNLQKQPIISHSDVRVMKATTSPQQMSKQTLQALSAVPRSKIMATDSWMQLKKKPKSKSENYNYQHWLIQEAEHRRITESKEKMCGVNVANSVAWNGNGNGNTILRMHNGRADGGKSTKPLPDAVINTLTRRLHNRAPLIDVNKQKSKNIIVEERKGKEESMLSVSGKKRCSHCRDELGRGAAMIIESLQLFYHIDCFKCTVCRIQLSDGMIGTDVRVRNNKLHCQNCYSNDQGVKFSCV